MLKNFGFDGVHQQTSLGASPWILATCDVWKKHRSQKIWRFPVMYVHYMGKGNFDMRNIWKDDEGWSSNFAVAYVRTNPFTTAIRVCPTIGKVAVILRGKILEIAVIDLGIPPNWDIVTITVLGSIRKHQIHWTSTIPIPVSVQKSNSKNLTLPKSPSRQGLYHVVWNHGFWNFPQYPLV